MAYPSIRWEMLYCTSVRDRPTRPLLRGRRPRNNGLFRVLRNAQHSKKNFIRTEVISVQGYTRILPHLVQVSAAQSAAETR